MSIVRVTQQYDGFGSYGPDQMVFISGADDVVRFYGAATTREQVINIGRDATISMTGTSNSSIVDLGQGTNINLCQCANLTVYDFQYDRTGVVNFSRQVTPPILSDDHHNGTLVTMVGGTVDFAGDKSLAGHVGWAGHPA